ncbi:hypothetical protein B0H13DRAFT_1895212, partial [Mycena leptocephala]
PVYAPSAISARGGKFRFLPGQPGYVTPTEIADPTVLIAQFKQAAINAKEAGFDGVESHRQMGREPGETARDSPLEVLKELVDVWGPDVAVKFNPAGGYNDMGMPLQDTIDTYGHLLREVNKLGLAYVRPGAIQRARKRGTQHDVIETFPPVPARYPRSSSTPGVTPAEAEELVGSGKAAGVFFGLNWVTHPDVGRRIKRGEAAR